MLYISIALVIIAVIVTVKPPVITIHHRYEMVQPTHPALSDQEQGPTDKELDEWRRNRPPTMEDVVAQINKTIFDIGGSDEEQAS